MLHHDELSAWNRTLRFAKAAHADQIRKYTGEPYWRHPARVAHTVAAVPNRSLEAILAALLHDVPDDTRVTLPEVRAEFGNVVASYVLCLGDGDEENRTLRNDAKIARLHNAPDEVHTIALSDLLDNTSSIAEHDPDFARVYLPEKDRMLKVLVRGDPALWKRCDEAIERSMAQIMLTRRHARLG